VISPANREFWRESKGSRSGREFEKSHPEIVIFIGNETCSFKYNSTIHLGLKVILAIQLDFSVEFPRKAGK
jgi:hypothetical protein